MFDPTPTCIHVCVRDAGGFLIDITGAHDEAEVVTDGAHSIRAVDTAFVDALTAEHDWAPADTAVAEAWVGPVLERGSRRATGAAAQRNDASHRAGGRRA